MESAYEEYDLSVHPSDGHLHIKVKTETMGVLTLREDLLPRITKAVQAANVDRLLYEYEVGTPSPSSLASDLMHELTIGLPAQLRVAFLTGEYRLDGLEASAVAAEIMGRDFRFFTTAEAARDWLLDPKNAVVNRG